MLQSYQSFAQTVAQMEKIHPLACAHHVADGIDDDDDDDDDDGMTLMPMAYSQPGIRQTIVFPGVGSSTWLCTSRGSRMSMKTHNVT